MWSITLRPPPRRQGRLSDAGVDDDGVAVADMAIGDVVVVGGWEQRSRALSEMKAVSQFGNHRGCVETWGDHLWAFCDEFGPRVFVTADTFETAWEEAVDALPAIPADEVPEAYGFDTDEELAAAASKAVRRENESPGTYGTYGEDQTPNLAEGYEYQSNATGTGIVWVGYHATLVCPTSDMLPEKWRGTKLSVTIVDRVFTVECEEVE